MSRDALVAEIRNANMLAVTGSVAATLPPEVLLQQASSLGELPLIAECKISVAIARERLGNVHSARLALEEVREMLEEGVELTFPWTWRYASSMGNLAEVFGDLEAALCWHQDAVVLADGAGLPGFPMVSRSNLGYISVQLGSLSEALGYFDEVAATPGLPTQYAIAVNLLVSAVLGQRHQFERAGAHLEAALAPVVSGEDIAGKRMLRTFALATLHLEEVALEPWHLAALRTFVEVTDSELARLESVFFVAKLDRLAGDFDASVAGIREVLSSVGSDMALRSLALLALAVVADEDSNPHECLEILAELDSGGVSAAVELSAMRLKRRCLENLGLWREASAVFEQIDRTLAHRAQDVVVLYELQQAASRSALIASQNSIFRRKNAELQVLAQDQELILEAVANRLQSPLTSLQLSLDALGKEQDEETQTFWLGIALRSVHRIDTLALQLSLVGEVDAGEMNVVQAQFELGELLREVTNLVRPGIRVGLDVSDEGEGRAGRVLVVSDPTRLVQLLCSLAWGIAEVSAADSGIRLSLALDGQGGPAIHMTAPALTVSVDELDRMRRYSPGLSSSERSPGPEVAFYLAQRMADLLGIHLDFLDDQFVLSRL